MILQIQAFFCPSLGIVLYGPARFPSKPCHYRRIMEVCLLVLYQRETDTYRNRIVNQCEVTILSIGPKGVYFDILIIIKRMDRRKLQQIETNKEMERESITIEDIVNSKRINEVLLDKAEELFALEFTLKQKAQLKYLQEKQKKSQNRIKLLNLLSHEFLWSPTPIYYCVTVALFMMMRRRYHLKPYTIIPFMSLPATMDYVKREYQKIYQFAYIYNFWNKQQILYLQVIVNQSNYRL